MNSFAFLFIALIGASNALIANTLHNSIKPLPTSRFYQSRLTETTCNYKLRYGVGNFSGSLSILPTVGLNNDWCSFEILCDVKRGCDIDLTVKFSGSLNVWTDGNMIFEVADHFATQKQVLYTSKVNNATIVYKPGNNRLNPQESAFSIAYYSKNAGLRALSALCALIALLVFAL